jgi:hypothetical protein
LRIVRIDGDPRWADQQSANISYLFQQVYYIKDTTNGASASGGFTLAAATDTVSVSATGTAQLRLFVDKLDAITMKDVLITATGAAIASVTAISPQDPPGAPQTLAAISVAPGEVQITPPPAPKAGAASPSTPKSKGPVTFDVTLTGLVPGRPVTIVGTVEPLPSSATSSSGATGSKQSVTISVVAPAARTARAASGGN